jgi:hypothetical protein
MKPEPAPPDVLRSAGARELEAGAEAIRELVAGMRKARKEK